MSIDQFRKVGWVSAAHGIRGELYVRISDGVESWVKELKEVCLVKDGQEERVKVSRVRTHKQGLVISVESVKDRNRAEELKGSEFYVPLELVTSQPGEEFFLHEILGFSVKDHNEDLGVIVGFSSNGVQDLLKVEVQSQIFEIPFVDEFIEKIDRSERSLWMQLPEGLVEL